jgi:hypothetical protein
LLSPHGVNAICAWAEAIGCTTASIEIAAQTLASAAASRRA